MKYTTTTTTALLAAAAVALTHAQNLESPSPYSSPVEKACNPNNSTGKPDFNAPCNAVKAIEYQCIYGPDYLQKALSYTENGGSYNRMMMKRQSNNENSDDDGGLKMQSNSTQRTCICESQFFDLINGCSSCYTAHGDAGGFDESIIDEKAIASLSSAYCAVSATPVGLADYLFEWASNYSSSYPASASVTSSSSMSDPIGNKTAVSLYFTPSVTGSAAWVIAAETSGSSTSENTVSGQIAPTASANNDAAQSGSDNGDSSSSSTGGAPVATAAGMGMLGLAGLVALL